MTDEHKTATETPKKAKAQTEPTETGNTTATPVATAPTKRAPRKTSSSARATGSKNLQDVPFENRVLTIGEVADHLGISSYTVQDMLRKGELPGTKVRSRWRITGAQVNEYMLANAQ